MYGPDQVSDVIAAIRRGDVDDYLTRIGDELNARYKAKRAEAVRNFAVGDRVRVADTEAMRAKPRNRQWIGKEGFVVSRNQQTLSVELDGEGGVLKVPSTLLEAAE